MPVASGFMSAIIIPMVSRDSTSERMPFATTVFPCQWGACTSKFPAGYSFPEVLPGGDALLVTAKADIRDEQGDTRIALVRLDSRETRVIIERGNQARHSPTGHVVFVRDGRLLAVAFDLDRLEVQGSPVPIHDDFLHTVLGAYELSDSGALAYVPWGTTTPTYREWRIES